MLLNSSAALWVAAMGRQLWFILKGSPAFDELKNTRKVSLSFIASFLGLASLRWLITSEYPLPFILASNMLYLLFVSLAIFIIPKVSTNSKTLLLSVILGVSILVDLLGSFLWIIGVPSESYKSILAVVELAGYVWVTLRFLEFKANQLVNS